jgi:hypothetical protein
LNNWKQEHSLDAKEFCAEALGAEELGVSGTVNLIFSCRSLLNFNILRCKTFSNIFFCVQYYVRIFTKTVTKLVSRCTTG